MSDTDSVDTQLRRNVRRIRRSNGPRPGSLTRSTGNLALVLASSQIIREDLALLSRGLTAPSSSSRHPRAALTGAMATPLIPREYNVTAPQRGPKKPVTTLVSMLPKTTYSEAGEKEGTVRSPAYIRVQLQLLQWLGLHASDTLASRQAHSWTQNIAENKRPQARDALRLCYYMRSQGFDTYAEFQKSRMSLYIVNPHTEVRSPKSDRLYWSQNFLNNDFAHELRTVPESSGAAGGRRNAFSSDISQLTTQELLASLDAVTAAGTAINRAQSATNLAAAVQDGNGGDTEDTFGPVLEDNDG